MIEWYFLLVKRKGGLYLLKINFNNNNQRRIVSISTFESSKENQQMVIECTGIRTKDFYLPSFTLCEGEILIIFVAGGQHYMETVLLLKDIFSGKKIDANVVLYERPRYVEHFTEPFWKKLFMKMTVEEYLNRNGNTENECVTSFHKLTGISNKTRVSRLTTNLQWWLSLHATLSHTAHIIFDLLGQDLATAKKSYMMIKDHVVKNMGSAILLDWADDYKNDCSQYIELQWTKKQTEAHPGNTI